MAINFSSLGQIQALKKITDGGEASIYEYDPKTVLKIFKSKVDLSKKESKVKYLISVRSKLPKNVIAPDDIVTINGKFVGYSMRKLNGAEDLHMLTKTKYLTTQNLSNQDVLQIMTSIGLDLNKLHSIGVLVGDVSDYNFQMNGKCNYFIDVDSWGIQRKYNPDAYTELFTCPDSYMPDGSIKFSGENENYNFAVLTFNMLTRIHPFGGTYLADKNLSTLQRMKKKISVLGKYKKDIKIPKIIGSWKWMSPKLEQDFIDIFENGKKIDITPDLQELLKNMKYCSVHDIYYYSKYTECPICNENANVKTAPVIAKVTQTANGPKLTIIFSGTDCAYVLSELHYINKNNEVVHFTTGRKHKLARGNRIDFSEDGKFMFVVSDDLIEVYNDKDTVIASIERMHKSNYLVKDNYLYYIDRGNNLVKAGITNNGILPVYLGQVYNPIFDVSDNGKPFIVSLYPKKAIIKTSDYNFEVKYSGRIKEYAIKHDTATGKWLFVYQRSNGKYRTMVFNKNKIEYDDDIINYNAQTLGNIDFHNNTIYDPDDGKIVGTNLFKNIAKEFPCSVVDENSKLKFTGRGFKIYNKNNIYNYG